jgi:hypothetical protein
VQDLHTEYEALKEELNRQQEAQLRVEITGRDGDPVYCQTSMQYGVVEVVDGTPYWEVFFDDNDDGTNITIPNFIETVEGLELRLGGNVFFRFDEAKFSPRHFFDRTRDDVAQMGGISFGISNIPGARYNVALFGRVGPIMYHDFMNALPQEELAVPDLVRFLNANRNNNNNNNNRQEVLLQELKIESVVFPSSRITGILALLKSMGILSTE